MSHSSFYRSVAYTLLFLSSTVVRGQTTTQLSPAPSYSDGIFTSPNTAATQIFDKGIDINITWATSYDSVNLYLINGVNYGASKGLTLGTTDTFFVWTVDDYGNNSLPFSFRAVNAEGTVDEQAGGGFYTGQFWIRDDTVAPPSSTPITTTTTSPMTTPATTTSPTSIPPTTMTVTATPSQTTTSQTTSSTSRATPSIIAPTTTAPTTTDRSTKNSPSTSTKTSAGLSSEPSSESSAASMSGSSQSSTEPPALATNTSAMSPANMQSASGPSTGTIAGIVVGAVAVLALIIGASLFFRRQRRPSASSRQLDLMEIQMAQEGHSGVSKPVYTLRDPSWDSSVQKRPAELAEDDVVELPNYRSFRPHELPNYRSSHPHELQ
ncbi:hypothetical protein E4T52_10744 [Aureobasidium sp. EXF-3400]|nr:hypothetical protein E4T51_04411 [Aureobasidium sp. EXF-12344]KAI4774275.1 hypothetical protein E4T52_10744 [Aureobasidium sp. EXF-3400]